ncbi:hypothetical protein [Planctomicrobium piriforme]|uniref:Uncharacterized protein n=1 Tax=Planctomicrobium piriforme TaxID=1576369 RepID=A0A1I3KBD4_9PLAN|nr:hypothetical protein [Planctomicrobium piriforme]SFI69802.1 hypothetical protein SAMN05421753_111176 [Planctomicrobium piriforme]
MTKPKHPILLTLSVLIVALFLYPLSYAPARVVAQGNPTAMPWVFQVYDPALVVINRSETLSKAFGFYCRFCGVRDNPPCYFLIDKIILEDDPPEPTGQKEARQ